MWWPTKQQNGTNRGARKTDDKQTHARVAHN